MFFVYMVIVLLFNIALFVRIRHGHCMLIEPRSLLCATCVQAAFLGLCVCMLLYMAKSASYSNLLQNLFFLNRQFINGLMWLPISREMLNRLMNVFSLCFTASCLAWASFADGRKNGKWVAMLVLFVTIAVITDPDVNRLLYVQLFPQHVSYALFRSIQSWVHTALLVLRIVVHINLILVMAKRMITRWGFKEMRMANGLIFVFSVLMQLLYFVLFVWTPTSLVQYHIYSGMTTYAKIPMAISYANINLLVAVQVVCFSAITICLIYQWWFETRLGAERQSMLRSMRDTSLISRSFAHYMKNEILAITTEIELAAGGDRQLADAAFQHISERCEQISLRLDRMRLQSLNAISLMHMDIQEVVDAAVTKMQQDAPDVLFSWKPERQPIMLWIDPLMMSEALKTVLQNAVEALQHVPAGRKNVRLRLQVMEHVLGIIIEDNGVGISPDDLPRVFEPYYTNKPAKTNWGLGLYMCRQIVLAHDGRMEVKSRQNHYTTVSIYLPIYKERNTAWKKSEC